MPSLRTAPFVLVLTVLLAGAAPARAGEPVTFLGAFPMGDGRAGVGGSAGFPYVSVRGLYGFGADFDAGLVARSAWGFGERVGLEARWRMFGDERMAATLRFGATGRVGAGDTAWSSITGEYDVTGSLELVGSWITARRSVMSVVIGALAIGNRDPPRVPLAGEPPWISFGANTTFRVAAEVPLENGLVVGFDLGFDLHLSGFDPSWLMPAFGVGIGAPLS